MVMLAVIRAAMMPMVITYATYSSPNDPRHTNGHIVRASLLVVSARGDQATSRRVLRRRD